MIRGLIIIMPVSYTILILDYRYGLCGKRMVVGDDGVAVPFSVVSYMVY